MNHYFNTNVAIDYDEKIAIFLANMRQWTFDNLANKSNIIDGYCWTYNTLDALLIMFPFWTRRQLETVIRNAISAGLLMKGNYNKKRYDRTCWYALTYKAYDYFPELKTPQFLETLYLSISPNGEMDFTEWGNAFHQNVTPIPNINEDIYINNINKINKDINIYINTKALHDEVPSETPQEISEALPLSTNTKKEKIKQFGLEEIIENNPHKIDVEVIEDWIKVRKSKRAPITKTTWNKINKTLVLIEQEAHIKPEAAFETMVASGWQSIELKYFLTKKTVSQKPQWNIQSVMEA